jgi:hypothetical protein
LCVIFALLNPDPDCESGYGTKDPIESDLIRIRIRIRNTGSTDGVCVVSRGPYPRMAAKRRSGRVTKQEVKYFKEESSDEEEEEVKITKENNNGIYSTGLDSGLTVLLARFSSLSVSPVPNLIFVLCKNLKIYLF